MSIYKVKLKKIKLFGYHGVSPEEKEKGQDFELDIKFSFKKQNRADEIEATLDYSEVCATAKLVFEDTRYNLLENLVEDIATAIMAKFVSVEKVKVSARKLKPPVGLELASVTVQTSKSR